MAAPEFQSLLQKPADDVKKPVPLPAGTYYGVVKSREFDKSKNKQTPYVRFVIALHSAGDDTRELCQQMGIDVNKKSLRKDYYLTTDAEYRLVEFAKSCSIETHGQSMGQIIEELLNQQVMLIATQRPSDTEDDTVYNDVGKIAGAQS